MTAQGAGAVVGWFRNDLRLMDNPMLHRVSEVAKAQSLPAFLVYIIDARFLGPFDLPEKMQPRPGIKEWLGYGHGCSARRLRFILRSIRELRKKLTGCFEGLELHVIQGCAETVFSALSSIAGPLQVVCTTEVGSPMLLHVESNVEQAISGHGGSLHLERCGPLLYHIDDLPFPIRRAPYGLVTLSLQLGYENVWESAARSKSCENPPEVRPLLAEPSTFLIGRPPAGIAWALPESDDAALRELGYSADEIAASVFCPEAGEDAACALLERWLALQPVKEDRWANNWDFCTSDTSILGGADPLGWHNLNNHDGWSRLSAHLAVGAISPRQVFWQAQDHWSLAGLLDRLLWRERHTLVAGRHLTELVFLDGIGRQDRYPKEDSKALERWKTGTTGVPYVDACMRELVSTGWLSYRGRKAVASCLALDLQLDWRVGARFFEAMQLDHADGLNYVNWQHLAQVDRDNQNWDFHDPRHREMKMKMRAEKRIDPEGNYIRKWVPELQDAKDPHAPTADCILGQLNMYECDSDWCSTTDEKNGILDDGTGYFYCAECWSLQQQNSWEKDWSRDEATSEQATWSGEIGDDADAASENVEATNASFGEITDAKFKKLRTGM
eukprot:gnl/MRDRNA2_/MRDRNA2_27462_c0_seq1.p1 gnl/MRDRNA2_/MRDRNA2_27462_c0~~gnl/MRDRNA2_/MRDRNA2_27462_c0_seq1.p1  ORF type:complete len:613 (+),score=98.58 gnl/MRDRNA2_/MRDRNA2_27462_c0_seq1:99-1937(+)